MQIRFLRLLSSTLSLIALAVLLAWPTPAKAQVLQLANPHWNISLTDFGYSDFLLDNTPGFEGREYLSGEWGAAVGYQVLGSPVTPPEWLEPHFIFPDWTTRSTFHVVTPIAQIGLNADGLPIAQSVIANSALEITLRHEMLDTIVGTPMGTHPASSPGSGAFLASDRYVLQQSATIRNLSGSALSNLQFFQFLHGLNSQRGVYDNRLQTGPLSEFQYDVTLAGVDLWAVGAGSSSAGLEDFIAFHGNVTPSAYEIGYYGVEGNGVDDHAIGKPSEGVHLSIEDNWQTAPYSTRLGTDQFTPPQRWVAGAQRWNLGNLAAGQSASLDLLLTLRTGTRTSPGTNSSGSCNGGSSVPGGVDYEFDEVSVEGSCFGEFSRADAAEIEVHIAQGEFDPFTFMTPGGPAQLWELSFSGAYAGAIHLTFAYDATILPAGFNENTLCLYQFDGVAWQKLTGIVDPLRHTIAVTTTSLSVFVLGVEGGTTFMVDASVAPANSGLITGTGNYAEGASVTLVAAADAGYVFTNWTDAGSVVSTSPSYTFIVLAPRTLAANFVPVGSGRSISTSSLPSNGGSTSGDGAYALGSSATVVATPNPGYKFSKWLENRAIVSLSSSYTFTVSSNRALVAKFKPVYAITTIADPAAGGEIEVDPFYEFGEQAVLKAKPNPGYCFVEWTQNGIPVCHEPIFEFTVTGNRELMGHFALGNLIRASAQPAQAGAVFGDGVYDAGASVTLEAIANSGYVFLNWSENGNPLSTSSVYNFTADTNHTMVANFIAQPALRCFLNAPGVLVVAWPAGANGWVLEQNASLASTNWLTVTNPVTIVNSEKQVILSPLTGQGYFRLSHP